MFDVRDSICLQEFATETSNGFVLFDFNVLAVIFWCLF